LDLYHKTPADTDSRHGAQGVMDSASKSTLENEFGTSNDEAVIAQILEKGAMQESEVSDHRRPNELFIRLTGVQNPERQGSKNDTMGGLVAH
jgi:Shwachman-Bodian-Diamond syndrome (SBDS) protein